jgi:starch-binding outer membrane protein, SusD/RagB family
MKKTHKLALVATFVGLAASGCNSFLTGDCISNSCNQPVTATADQLFIGVQVAVMGNWETYPMNLLPLWTQQIAGVNRQWASYSNFGSGTDNLTADALWIGIYASGGLADIRKGIVQATEAGNMKAVGQFQVLEALNIGFATDLWGDVPFDSIGTSFPKFDSQSAVYPHVQALLDSALANLAGGGSQNVVDFFFNGDLDKWAATAHTLKARYYMHTAENSDLSYDNAKLNSVLTETALGISSTDGDFATVHSATTFEQNLFYEFLIGSRAGDVEPASLHINLAKQFNDNVLLAQLYNKNNANQYLGSPAGVSAGSNVSTFAISPSYRQGIVTYAENLLLSAEAHYRLSQAGPALTELNLERAAYGESGSAVVPGGTNGLLVGILQEKFVRLFLSPEVYFDYLRTCVPNVALPANHTGGFEYVPARLPYGFTEATTNVANIPADPIANAVWPKHPTDPSGVSCSGQVNRPGA